MLKKCVTPIIIVMAFTLVHCSPGKSGDNNRSTINEVIYPTDTLTIKHAVTPPIVDGIGDDEVWKAADWLPVNQVWIPYGEEIDSAIFHGRYKVTWSEEENLLYILTHYHPKVF